MALVRRAKNLWKRRRYPAQQSPEGRWGRVTHQGAIRGDGLGEVAVPIRGGMETFYARSVDGKSIPSNEDVVVVVYTPPRTVTVARVEGRTREDTWFVTDP